MLLQIHFVQQLFACFRSENIFSCRTYGFFVERILKCVYDKIRFNQNSVIRWHIIGICVVMRHKITHTFNIVLRKAERGHKLTSFTRSLLFLISACRTAVFFSQICIPISCTAAAESKISFIFRLFFSVGNQFGKARTLSIWLMRFTSPFKYLIISRVSSLFISFTEFIIQPLKQNSNSRRWQTKFKNV